MREIAIYLKEIWKGLDEDDIIAIAAAEYITNEYDIEVDDDDLDDVKSYIDNDRSHNFLTRIENTFANIDREYCEEEEDEEDSYWDTDESYDDDYEDDEYDEDEVDNETMRLIEQNRKKNEQVLGL